MNKPYAPTDHVSTESNRFIYPGAGGQLPPRGCKVNLLTKGGVCVEGVWRDGCGFVGWAPLPSRDKEAERKLGMR